MVFKTVSSFICSKTPLKQQAAGQEYYYNVIDYLEKSKSEHTVYMGSNILCNIDLRALLKIHQLQNKRNDGRL